LFSRLPVAVMTVLQQAKTTATNCHHLKVAVVSVMVR
jgi:hypothetical protein